MKKSVVNDNQTIIHQLVVDSTCLFYSPLITRFFTVSVDDTSDDLLTISVANSANINRHLAAGIQINHQLLNFPATFASQTVSIDGRRRQTSPRKRTSPYVFHYQVLYHLIATGCLPCKGRYP